MALEQAARSREELNALYVALTRTQTTLVVSSLEPHIQNPGSWWQRLQAQAQDAPWPLGADVVDAAKGGLVAGGPAVCQLKVLPVMAENLVPNSTLAPVEYAQAATKSIANSGLSGLAVQAQGGIVGGALAGGDSVESRIGQAMHRLLEWFVPQPAGGAAAPWLPEQVAAAAREFALDPAQVDTARHMALAIVRGEGAWAWDASQLSWQCNELALTHRGRLLRLDRLVQRRDSGQWWVLDHKSNANPQQDPALCAQLLTYRSAVAQAYTGQTVRAAFLTPQGKLIELQCD